MCMSVCVCVTHLRIQTRQRQHFLLLPISIKHVKHYWGCGEHLHTHMYTNTHAHTFATHTCTHKHTCTKAYAHTHKDVHMLHTLARHTYAYISFVYTFKQESRTPHVIYTYLNTKAMHVNTHTPYTHTHIHTYLPDCTSSGKTSLGNCIR